MRNSQIISNTSLGLSFVPIPSTYEIQKRLLDILFSLILLILTVPFLLLAGICIKAVSKGPAIYHQKRVGLWGQEFTIYKLRTMEVNAGGSLDTAVRNDPRCIYGGGFLRRTHLDELPQLWNVLKGDMSLVGPRPRPKEIDEEWRKIIPEYNYRQQVRPGITGPAQICGRSASASEKIDAFLRDMDFIENQSIKEYLKLLFFTVPHVLLAKSV